jgi:hypothetical protein
MHKTDGANNVAGMFKDSPTPGTTVEHLWLNATQEEIVNSILKSGQTLFASGALDAAAATPYVQLANAISRLGRSYGDIVQIQMNGASSIATEFDREHLCYELTPDPGGDEPGTITNLPSNLSFNAHTYVLLVINGTPTYKKILATGGKYYFIAPEQAILFYGWEHASSIIWCPLNSESGLIRGTEIINFTRSDGYNQDITCAYTIRDGIVSLDIPEIHHNFGGDNVLINMTVPSNLSSYGHEAFPVMVLSDIGVRNAQTGSFGFALGTQSMVATIQVHNVGAFAGGQSQQTIRYRSYLYPLVTGP